MVVWITGLSGAGKSTFAKQLINLLEKNFSQVVHLDGDELRKILDRQTPDSYLRKNRLELASCYAKLSKNLSDQGLIVIISTISLFTEIHNWNQKNIKAYIEVLLKPSLQTLKKRNQKNLYSDFKNGFQKNVYGLDINYDFPKHPDFNFSKFGEIELEKVKQKILNTYRGKKNEN